MSKNWNPLIRSLHWLSVLILVACVAAVWGHELFASGTPERAAMMQTHFLAGGLLGALGVLRIASRLASQAPTPAVAPSPLMAKLAKAGHLAIYGFLLALPLAGYIAVSGRGVPIDLLGLVSVPPLSVDKDFAHTAKELHEGLANGFLFVLAGHVAAALYHALVLKDGVVGAMLGKNK